MHRICNAAAAEYVLKCFPNGGSAILIRSLIVCAELYAVALGLRYWTAPSPLTLPWWEVLRYEFRETIPWIGAIFAGVYIALYTRFAAQWQYLAGLYNEIMATCIQSPPPRFSRQQENVCSWHAAFIEDADALHLATKPSFAPTIYELLKIQDVRACLSSCASRGDYHVVELRGRIRRAVARERFRRWNAEKKRRLECRQAA